MRCVVCGGAIRPGNEQYANAWERTRKRYPCCGALCTAEFDVDVHWIPAVLPTLADEDEQPRLRKLARERLTSFDEARPVVRELLLAGIDPASLRQQIAFSAQETRTEKRNAFIAGVKALFGRRLLLVESRDQRSKQSYAFAAADLDRWEAVVAARR